MTKFNNPLPNPNSTIDGEHRIQVGLINALCNAVDVKKSVDETGAILEQLVDYCEAHFVSEELLMRLDNYDEFQGHVEDHQKMMDRLKQMVQSHREGNLDLLPGQVRNTLVFLLNHIDTIDRRYSTHR
jgi:hemerythrin-like metal-binding protein